MRRRLPLCALLSLLSVVFAMSGCERRPLTYDYRPWCDVRVNVDWTAFGRTPTGMTLMFFPQDGSEQLVITTTETSSTSVNLQAGKYNILVFNQSPDEFGTIGFRGMDSFETAEIFAREADAQWHLSEVGGEKAAHEPERLGMDRIEDFEVTEEMVERSMRNSADRIVPITLHPQCVVSTALVRVRVKGIHNVRSVRGSMSGMAEGHSMSQGRNNDGKVTHLLEEWKVSHDKADYTTGEVTVAFSTFGLPDGHPAAAADVAADVATGDNRLHVSFLLVDNKTVKDFQFEVANRIETREGEDLTLVVEIGTAIGGNAPEDQPVEIEDVKPENGSEGGFDATVDDWGEREEIDIPI